MEQKIKRREVCEKRSSWQSKRRERKILKEESDGSDEEVNSINKTE